MTLPRRWLRFSLRTMLVMVTVLACWLGYSLNWIGERNAIKDSGKIMQTIGSCRLDAPGWLWLFGETGEWGMVLDVARDDPLLKRVNQLFPESGAVSVHDTAGKWDNARQ